MQEDIRKNFILLSEVAKKKKYAQEYLGLLARRGDIGSIRIGKRWYTTWAWYEEFLENSQKKKEAVSEVQVVLPIVADKIVMEKIFAVENKEEKIKINVPFIFPEREKVMAVQPVAEMIHEEKIAEAPAKIAVAVNPQGDQMALRKDIAADRININSSASPIRSVKMQAGKIQIRRSVAEKNRYAIPYQEIKFKKKAGVFSPGLSVEENMFAPLFSHFAFAMSFAVILLLVAASGYFVWSGGLLRSGQVAGASDERNAGFSGIAFGGEYVLVSVGDKMKESLSVSRVMVAAAKERGNAGN